MSIRMTILGGELKGQAFVLEGESITVGRGPGVDMEIKDPSISKVHARIEESEGQIRVLDLGSRNGIRAGGKTVNKVKFQKGSIQIGRIPVRLEFESEVNQVPISQEAPKAEDIPETHSTSSASFSATSENKSLQIMSLAALILTLVGILLWGFQDVLWPSAEPTTKLIKVPESKENFRIPLPTNVAGDQIQFSRDVYDAELAEGTRSTLVIHPFTIGSSVLSLRFVDGQVINYDIHVVPSVDNERTGSGSIIGTPISEEEKKEVLSEVKGQLDSATRLFKRETLDDNITAWKNCQWIIDECRKYLLTPPELNDARRLMKNIDRQLNKERERLFNDAKNDVTLYTQTRQLSDLLSGIKKMDKIFDFTNEEFVEYNRYRTFAEHLEKLKREHK